MLKSVLSLSTLFPHTFHHTFEISAVFVARLETQALRQFHSRHRCFAPLQSWAAPVLIATIFRPAAARRYISRAGEQSRVAQLFRTWWGRAPTTHKRLAQTHHVDQVLECQNVQLQADWSSPTESTEPCVGMQPLLSYSGTPLR